MGKCLMVIDLQEGYFDFVNKGKMNKKKCKMLVQAVNSRIGKAERDGECIVYIRQECPNKFFYKHIFPRCLIQGTREVEISSEIKKVGDNCFTKRTPNAFRNKKLDQFLKEKSIDTVEIIGTDLSGCVLGTAKGAVIKGYKVLLNLHGISTSWIGKIDKSINKLEKKNVKFIGSKSEIIRFDR